MIINDKIFSDIYIHDANNNLIAKIADVLENNFVKSGYIITLVEDNHECPKKASQENNVPTHPDSVSSGKNPIYLCSNKKGAIAEIYGSMRFITDSEYYTSRQLTDEERQNINSSRLVTFENAGQADS